MSRARSSTTQRACWGCCSTTLRTYGDILYYHILSYIILCYSILSYFILYYHILSYIILYYHILSHIIIYHLILAYTILYYPIHIICYSILAYIVHERTLLSCSPTIWRACAAWCCSGREMTAIQSQRGSTSRSGAPSILHRESNRFYAALCQ